MVSSLVIHTLSTGLFNGAASADEFTKLTELIV